VYSFSLEIVGQGFTLAKQVLYRLSHTSSPFCSGYFGDGGLMNYLPRLASTYHPPDLLISASQVAKITDVSHQCLASSILIQGVKLFSYKTNV
jgi:hypothetical protein